MIITRVQSRYVFYIGIYLKNRLKSTKNHRAELLENGGSVIKIERKKGALMGATFSSAFWNERDYVSSLVFPPLDTHVGQARAHRQTRVAPELKLSHLTSTQYGETRSGVVAPGFDRMT